ncbi:site-specific integrase [Paenibacillus sp. FSL H7-0331]|nr:site-specific integrase [Paenibacillus sp. FSL H7-0331]
MNYPTDSKTTYEKLFLKSEQLEREQCLDLYEFDINHISDFVRSLKLNYVATARNYGSIIKSYITWAIHEGYTKNPLNPLEGVPSTWFDQFITTDFLPYFSYKQIRSLSLFCENAQDAVIIEAIFEGIQGKEVCELRNLKLDDVNFDENKVRLIDENGEKRTLVVSHNLMETIEDALSETTYLKKNGRMEGESNVRYFTDLVDSNFVVRSSNTTRDKTNGAVDKHVIFRRLTTISKLYAIANLNVKNISRSGMIKMGYDLLNIYGKLERDQYLEIAERYKINSLPSLKEIVSVQNINRLYDSHDLLK